MLAIATNLPGFVENPSRRITAQFGQASSLSCVYQGMEVNYPAWSPKRGSSHPNYPSMFLATISREDKGGGLIDVTLTYLGTLLQQQHYTDLAINVDLLTQSFSWSGPAGWKNYAVQFTFDAQYVTISVTFAYTAYQYQGGAIFQSMASGFVQIMDVFTNITTAPLSPGIYTGYPTIPSPIKPLLMLTRYSCQQQTPSKQTTQNTPDVVNTPGIWKCQETWQLNYNHGSLGFYEPNDVSPNP
jgi:hypothetical protein